MKDGLKGGAYLAPNVLAFENLGTWVDVSPPRSSNNQLDACSPMSNWLPCIFTAHVMGFIANPSSLKRIRLFT